MAQDRDDAGGDPSGDDDLLSEAQEQLQSCLDAEADNRAAAKDDLEFARLAKQWPEKIAKDRETEGRPCLTINRLPAYIRQVVNDARQNKPSIRVRPVDSGADPETADIMNGLIRNIEQSSNADVAYDTAADFAVTMGYGYFRIAIDYAHDDTFDQELRIERVANPFAVYGDPHSTEADSADWNVAFMADVMTRESFRKRWKGAEEVDWSDLGYGNMKAPWSEGDDILVAEWWRREETTRTILKLSDGLVVEAGVYESNRGAFEAMGVTVEAERQTRSHKVTQRIITGAEILETTEWAGKYIPIVPVYGDEVNVEGKRYFRSLIRDAKDAQRMFNYWRTMSTELVALAPKAPFIGPEEAFRGKDANRWDTANTESWPYLSYPSDSPAAPQRQQFGGIPAGALQEALNSSDDIKSILGMFDASMGARSNETSGKAIIARQREGDTSTFHFQDNVTRAIRHAGRILIDLIPAVYTGERVIRVLGEDGRVDTIPLNQEVMRRRLPDGRINAVPMAEAAEMPQEPHLPPPEQRIYDLGLGKYDLAVDAGPSFTTRREEAAYQMTELIRAYPQGAPIMADQLAKNMDWPGADILARRFKKMLPPGMAEPEPGEPPPQPPGPPPEVMAEMAKLKLLQEKTQAEIAAKEAKTQADISAMQAKTQADISAMQAKTQAQIENDRAKLTAELQLKLAEQRADMLQQMQTAMQPAPAPAIHVDGQSVAGTMGAVTEGMTALAQALIQSVQQIAASQAQNLAQSQSAADARMQAFMEQQARQTAELIAATRAPRQVEVRRGKGDLVSSMTVTAGNA